MNKRVLLVNSSLSQGGSERAMTVLANGLLKKGFEVTMVLLRKKEKTYKLNNGIKCIQLEYTNENKVVILLQRFKKLRSIIKQFDGEYVISFMDDINKVTLLASLGLKKKIIISERAYPLAGRNNFDRKMENILYPLSYQVVFQTDQVKQYYGNRIISKSSVIPNPINSELPDIYNGERKKEIVAVGRLSRQKNFEMLIEAFSKIATEYPEHRLIIYGDGPLRHDLEEIAEKLGVSERVSFPGYVADVNTLMSKAQVYVSSSDYEGISNSMLEALGMGLPCICTDCPVGGASLVIKNMISGILIPVGDTEALVNALRDVLSSDSLRKILSENSVKVRERFSPESITEKWIELMK